MLEGFDALNWTFCESFDASIIEVLYVPDDLMTRGGALRKETKADALYVAADEKSSRDFGCHNSSRKRLVCRYRER